MIYATYWGKKIKRRKEILLQVYTQSDICWTIEEVRIGSDVAGGEGEGDHKMLFIGLIKLPFSHVEVSQ